MQLGKKKQVQTTYQNNQPQYKPGVPVNWKTETICRECELPHGKYRGKTLGDVIDDDPKYYSWLLDNNLLTAWALVKSKTTHKKENKLSGVGYRTESGEIWLGLREVPGIINNNTNIEIPY